MTRVLFPGWRWGPEGQCELFQREEDMPEGWTRIHPANWPDGAFPGTAAPSKAPSERPNLFDHDNDGRSGGSVAAPAHPDLPALRAQYTRVFGKKPFNGWGADELTRRIGEAQ